MGLIFGIWEGVERGVAVHSGRLRGLGSRRVECSVSSTRPSSDPTSVGPRVTGPLLQWTLPICLRWKRRVEEDPGPVRVPVGGKGLCGGGRPPYRGWKNLRHFSRLRISLGDLNLPQTLFSTVSQSDPSSLPPLLLHTSNDSSDHSPVRCVWVRVEWIRRPFVFPSHLPFFLPCLFLEKSVV